MSHQKSRHKEYSISKSEADEKIAEIRDRIEKLLERTRQIDAVLMHKEKELRG